MKRLVAASVLILLAVFILWGGNDLSTYYEGVHS